MAGPHALYLGRLHHAVENLVVVGAAAQVAGEPWRSSARVGLGFVFRKPVVAMMKPDMQKAHWKPWPSTTRLLHGG